MVVPTHSNQNNIALLTGQYPDGNDVPANDWLSRANGFQSPVSVGGALTIGDYALYAKNPLLTRGDSVYRATRRAGGRTAYVGELPPFEAGADEAHLTIVGTQFATPLGLLTVDKPTAENILTGTLGYPQKVADGYAYDGPPMSGETQTQFTLRDAADFVRATSPSHPMPSFMFVWDFLALDDDPTSTYGADGPQLAQIIEQYDAALGQLLAALDDKGLTASTNILFTLDHGKVDTHKQVVLGTHGGADADGQLGALVAAQGAALGIDGTSYALLNEDGDAHVYANVPGAGTPAGAAAQADVTHKLLALIQSGAIAGVDTTRTMTADGAMGTRTFKDFRATSPNQADILVFPQPDWTLNQVDATNSAPGPFQEHAQFAYGRHGGFSADELYVPLDHGRPGVQAGRAAAPPRPPPRRRARRRWRPWAAAVALQTAARGPIHAALAGDPGETIAAARSARRRARPGPEQQRLRRAAAGHPRAAGDDHRHPDRRRRSLRRRAVRRSGDRRRRRPVSGAGRDGHPVRGLLDREPRLGGDRAANAGGRHTRRAVRRVPRSRSERRRSRRDRACWRCHRPRTTSPTRTRWPPGTRRRCT